MTYKILWFIFVSSFFVSLAAAQSAISVWIDTDIGNDFDDELALSYGLQASNWQIEGISTTHWRHEGPCDLNTSDSSFVLAQQLVQAFSGRKVRVLKGNDTQLANVYGAIDCNPSTAVDHLISVARAHSPERPLHIIGLGAATNIALALCRAPDIRNSIRVYLLAAQYDAIGDFWDKNEFNVQNDLPAFDYLLDTDDLDVFILPANMAASLGFSKDWLQADDKDAADLRKYLFDRWDRLDSMRSSWTAYDLALVVAIAQPQWVEWTDVDTPPENGYGKVKVATYLDVPAIQRHLVEVWKASTD
jgi:inosine-uridine nucleoside N-ribohydrolase